MTVEQLIKELSKYNPSAELHFILEDESEINFWELNEILDKTFATFRPEILVEIREVR